MVETRRLGDRTITFQQQRGEGPAIVCIHGSADNHHVYDELLAALPDRELYAINLPGRAGTDGPPIDDVAGLEEFLQAFVDAEIQRDYWVAGHSLGGAVAIEHALLAPNRLQGVVLLATGGRLRVHPMILQLFEQVKSSGGKLPPPPPGLYERGTPTELIDKATKDRELTPIDAGDADWHAADSFDRLTDVSRITVPALIVAGTEDTLTPVKYAEYLSDHIADSELHVIEGAGHMLVMERAREIAGWIEASLDRRR